LIIVDIVLTGVFVTDEGKKGRIGEGERRKGVKNFMSIDIIAVFYKD